MPILYSAGNSRYMNFGTSTLVTGDTGQTMILGFDLSALAGATINRAELRIRATQGNSTMQWAAIKSRDWVEGTKNNTYPGAAPPPAPASASPTLPGLYTAASAPRVGAPAANAMFSLTGDGQDLYTWTTFTSIPIGAAFPVANVTTLVQEWASGTKPNYGLVINIG